MRHRVAHRKLGRVTEHRIALLRNQATALLRHEAISTTVPKAKELRPYVERLITIAKRGVAGGATNGRVLHARRLVLQDIVDQDVVGKLFDTIAPRFESRPGGYTRLLRLGHRRGDSADMARVELVGSEFDPKVKAEAEAKRDADRARSKRGVSDRLRAAASRVRGKKADGDEGDKPKKKAAPKREPKAKAEKKASAANTSKKGATRQKKGTGDK
jgi:large subunit ribosomal protein L17